MKTTYGANSKAGERDCRPVSIHAIDGGGSATKETADPATAELLAAVQKKLGAVPNIIATMAASPAVVQAYLGFSEALASGSLPARLREQIALVVGEANGCSYCVAAHTALGKRAGLSEQATCDARRGVANDAKEQAALQTPANSVTVYRSAGVGSKPSAGAGVGSWRTSGEAP